MKKTKQQLETEAKLRERTSARLQAKKQKEAEQRAAKKQKAAPVAAKEKRLALQDCEPPERPLSTFNARYAFLSKILAIAPATVDALFDSCLESFLRLTQRVRSIQASADDPMTVAESNPLDWLELDERELKDVFEWNPSFDGLPELQDRLAEEQEFCGRLAAWGCGCNVNERWFLDFGWLTLLHYWQEMKPKPLKAVAPPVTDSERRNLLIGPPGARTVNVSEQRRARAIAAVTGAAPRLPPPVTVQPVVDSVEVIRLRRRNAWHDALRFLMETCDIEMTAPEHAVSNKYQMVGFFRFVEKPKYLQLQPPPPPPGLPAIADVFSSSVPTLKLYRRIVSRKLYAQLGVGPAEMVPEDVREKWRREGVQHLTPHVDAYWRTYTDYLKAQGWMPVKPKRALSLHCEWLARFVVLGMPLGEIAETVDRANGISESSISEAVRDVALLAGVRWEERRGRKSG